MAQEATRRENPTTGSVGNGSGSQGAPRARAVKAEAGNDRSLQERAYWFVRQAILNHALRQGQSLKDSDIAAQLSISRTPVREALSRLEHEGLVDYVPHRGWMVHSLDHRDIEQIFEIKEVVEGMLARRATENLTEEFARGLRAAITKMGEAARAGDRTAWVEADSMMHEAIHRAAGNDRATEIIANLNAQWVPLRLGITAVEGRMDRSFQEHQAVVEHILARDAEGAERLMKEHFANLKLSLLDLWTHLIQPFITARED